MTEEADVVAALARFLLDYLINRWQETCLPSSSTSVQLFPIDIFFLVCFHVKYKSL
jgi:hypothetical protein